MKNLNTHPLTWRGLWICGAMLAATMLSACATTSGQSDADQQTCAGMGARYGSPTFTACMLQQQRRRDNKMGNFLKEQRMHQELGRPAREKLEEKRERRAREQLREGQRD